MKTITVGPSDDLRAALDGAHDTEVTFTGTHRVGKVRNLRNVTLKGGDETAVIVSSETRDVGNLRVEDSSGVVLQGFAIRDATMQEARALQLFRCEQTLIEDLRLGPNVWLDLCHLVDCRNTQISGLRCDGTGGKGGRGGTIGSHAIYATGRSEDLLVEDVDAEHVGGAVYQLNGDGQTVSRATFRRIRATDFGRQGGAGFNLTDCAQVTLEDVTLTTTEHAGGVRAYGTYSGVSLTRYAISVVGFPPVDAQDGGRISVTPGTPTPPNFGTAPPIEPPPITEPPTENGDLEAAQAEVSRLASIIDRAAAVLAEK